LPLNDKVTVIYCASVYGPIEITVFHIFTGIDLYKEHFSKLSTIIPDSGYPCPKSIIVKSGL